MTNPAAVAVVIFGSLVLVAVLLFLLGLVRAGARETGRRWLSFAATSALVVLALGFVWVFLFGMVGY